MGQRTLYRCGNCGTTSVCEEPEDPCPTCGKQLDVRVRTLVDPDEAELADLREEELAFERVADDVDCEPE